MREGLCGFRGLFCWNVHTKLRRRPDELQRRLRRFEGGRGSLRHLFVNVYNNPDLQQWYLQLHRGNDSSVVQRAMRRFEFERRQLWNVWERLWGECRLFHGCVRTQLRPRANELHGLVR